MSRRSRLAARPRLEVLDDRCVLSSLTPSLIDSAYGLNAVTYSNGTVKGTGEGQTIAIVDAYKDPTIYSDLTAFDQKYGLPNPKLTTSPASNGASSTASGSFTAYDLAGSATDSGWSEEEALDVEIAHAAAPGANIVLVEAASASTTDLIAAVNYAKSIPGVSVISMSWGSSEFRGETAYDSVFTTPAGHTGITFLAAAGDSGSGAEWPASSPNVVGVGGTSLIVNSSGTRTSETAWSSTGGGYSRYEAEPSYQKSAQSTGRRSTPDVSAVANPSTGVVIVSAGQQVQLGGTSLSTPIWAGLIAIADQGLAITGKGSLDGATQTLPKLYSAPSGSFDDVTTGARSRTTVGYDTATGLGTPNAQTLIPYLAGTSTTAAVTTTTGTTTTTTGGGTTTTTTGGGTTTTGGGTTTAGGGTTPVIPTRPPFWWSRFFNFGGYWWGGFSAPSAGQSPTYPGRPSWS